jgi:hypothetical protein
MGYSIYTVRDRDAGYGVPAFCDHPDCNEEIDRGLSYICGGEPASDSRGCNLYFCWRHLHETSKGQLCERCWPRRRKPFDPKPDMPKWMVWKLEDESWAQWREENPEEVKRLKSVLEIGGQS